MAQSLDVKRLLATGKQFTDNGRTQARQLGTELATHGRLATEQVSAAIDELTSRGSRERIEELRRAVRDEVQREISTLRESMHAELARTQVDVDRIAAVVDEFDTQPRERGDRLREMVRDEVQSQLSSLGPATKKDVVALGRALRNDLTELESRVQPRAESSINANEDNPRQDAPLQVTPPHHSPPTS
jgi:polyhydroxyalkanoate synthesis regulator phasin